MDNPTPDSWQLSPEASRKLKVVSFYLMLMVVFIHAYNIDYLGPVATGENRFLYDLAVFVENFISQGVARIAVPYFFIISGFLFFLNLNFTWEAYNGKLKRRIRTIFIPYLFWSGLWILFFVILESFPAYNQFASEDRGLISSLGTAGLLDRLLIHPIAFQLWFLRDLFVLIVLSPLIYFLLKKIPLIFLALVFIAWFFNFEAYIFKNFEPLMFFSLGGFIVLNRPQWIDFTYRRSFTYLLTVAWLFLVIIRIMLKIYNGLESHPLEFVFHKLGILVGMIAFWSLYGFHLIPSRKKLLDRLIPFSFFLFCFHEPFLTFFRKVLLKILGNSPAVIVNIYFIATFIVIVVSIAFGYFLKASLPKVYNWITGGR